MRSLMNRLRARLSPGAGDASDEHLLAEFLAHRDAPARADEAFAAIVRRHGPMVRGVCRRALRNEADADDAAQAVWLVLVQKAEAVRPRSRLGNFLYGVAVNVARRARDRTARRAAQELPAELPGRAVPPNDLRDVLDEELSALPGDFRAAVVACDLEGHTRAEAAARLGWSEGTVASRLARGRARLAERLTRRGVALPAAGLAVALGSNAAGAVSITLSTLAKPSPLAEALAQEVMRAMTTTFPKSAAVLAGAVLVTGGAVAWACVDGLFPNPPAEANKPFPLESVEARPRPRAEAMWARPLPEGTADAGSDKPAGADAGIAKPARFVLVNPNQDIRVVSDRHETFEQFFRRQPVMVARVSADLRNKLLHRGPGPVPAALEFTFVADASFNTDGPRAAAYGASVKLQPVPDEWGLPTAGNLIDNAGPTDALVFVPVEGQKHTWRPVGFTGRAPAAFFASAKREGRDPFAPADLLHAETKEPPPEDRR